MGRAQGQVILVAPERHLVTGLDAELVTELLGDDDLALGTYSVGHTEEYNHPQKARRGV